MTILVSYSSHSARRKRLKVKKTKISLPNTLHALHLRFETKALIHLHLYRNDVAAYLTVSDVAESVLLLLHKRLSVLLFTLHSVRTSSFSMIKPVATTTWTNPNTRKSLLCINHLHEKSVLQGIVFETFN